MITKIVNGIVRSIVGSVIFEGIGTITDSPWVDSELWVDTDSWDD